jgi:hypothetical protein
MAQNNMNKFASHGRQSSSAPSPAWAAPSMNAPPRSSPDATHFTSGATDEERLPAYFEQVTVVPSRLSRALGLPPSVTVILSQDGLGVATPDGDLLMTERYLMIKRIAQGIDMCSLEFGSLSATPGVLHLAVNDDFALGTSNPPRLGINDRIREASARVAHRPDSTWHFAEVKVVRTPLSASLNLPSTSVAITLGPREMRVSGARVNYVLPYTHIQRFGASAQGGNCLVSLLFGAGATHPGVLHLAPVQRASEFVALMRKRVLSPPGAPTRYRFEHDGVTARGFALDEADDERIPALLQADMRRGAVHYDGVQVVESSLSNRLGLPRDTSLSVTLDKDVVTVGNDRVCLRQPHEAIKRYALNADGTLCSLEFGGALCSGKPGLLHLGFAQGGAEFHELLLNLLNAERPGEGTTSL